MAQINVTGCSSLDAVPASSVRALKPTRSTEPSQWPGLIPSSTTGHLTVCELLRLFHYSGTQFVQHKWKKNVDVRCLHLCCVCVCIIREVLAWFSFSDEVQMIRIWSSWCHRHPIISWCSKIQNGLPFWCRFTQVVLEKRPLNGCSMCI